jgi:hypothetical protein
MTSLKEAAGQAIDMQAARHSLERHLQTALGMAFDVTDLKTLTRLIHGQQR